MFNIKRILNYFRIKSFTEPNFFAVPNMNVYWTENMKVWYDFLICLLLRFGSEMYHGACDAVLNCI